MTAVCLRCDPPTEHVDLAAHAEQAGHPLCVLCGHRSLQPWEPQACARCVERCAENLSDVEAAFHALNDVQSATLGSRHVHPGGDALVMRAGGSDGRTAVFGAVLADGLAHDEHAADELPEDPPSIAWTLARWEDDWRRLRGEPAALPPANAQLSRPRAFLDGVVRRSVAYLQGHGQWAAASHDGWADFAEDMRTLRARVHGLLRDEVRAERGAPCLACSRPDGLVLLERGWEDPSVCRHERPDLRLLWVRNVTSIEWIHNTGLAFGDKADAAKLAALGWCACDGYSEMPHLHETVAERNVRVAGWEAEHARCVQGGRGEVWVCPRCGDSLAPAGYLAALQAGLEARHAG